MWVTIFSALVLLIPLGSFAEPIVPGAIEVIDGDTVRAYGRIVRLVGFDAFRKRIASAL
jgi:hypothetical protein